MQEGSHKIRFSEQFERDSLKLIELPAEIASELSSGMQSLVIRGNVDDNVVIVNQNQTFKVNLLETSNTLLLLKPSMFDDKLHEVYAAPNHHLELVKSVPDMQPLVNKLNQHCIDADHLDVFYSEPGTGNPPGVSMRELIDFVQASDAEIEQELVRRRAIEVQGYWFCLDVRLINTVLSEIIDIVQACSMPMDRLSFMEIATELSDAYPSLLIRHILQCFKSNAVDETNQDVICLDERLVSRQIAIRILLEHPKMPYADFMDKWRMELPGLLQADEEYLKGIAYRDETTFQKNLVYIPIEKLPLDPKARLDFLFGLRAKWPVDDMLAFLEDNIARGHSSETIIMRHTKTVQKGQYYVAKTMPR